MKKFSLVFLAIIFLFLFSVGQVLAQTTGSDNPAIKKAQSGLDVSAEEGFGKVPSQTDIPTIIGFIVGVGLSFIGVLFFVLMIYGGFLWMTARGNEEQVNKAVNIITQAAIGLIIVAAAYLITRFVGETIINSVTK